MFVLMVSNTVTLHTEFQNIPAPALGLVFFKIKYLFHNMLRFFIFVSVKSHLNDIIIKHIIAV